MSVRYTSNASASVAANTLHELAPKSSRPLMTCFPVPNVSEKSSMMASVTLVMPKSTTKIFQPEMLATAGAGELGDPGLDRETLGSVMPLPLAVVEICTRELMVAAVQQRPVALHTKGSHSANFARAALINSSATRAYYAVHMYRYH